MSPQEFSEAWGEGLSPVAPAVLQATHIAEPAKRFLGEAGLPREAKPNLTFYSPPDMLTPMPNVLEEVDLPLDFQRYLLLADDGGTFLCIDMRDNEQVVSVDPYQELPTRVVNSAVPQFAECLLAYRALPGPEQAKGADKQTIRDWIAQLEQQFNRIDSAALSGPDNWWSVVIEELTVFTR